jgi:hypothetical protein
MAGEVFISYRRVDQDKARLLHALLKQRGVDAWYDGLLGPGDDWRHKTAQALEAAPIFVLMFSKVASESDDISKELAAATFSKKLVIPVRIENIKPSGAFLYELASRNWVDAWDDTEAKFADLADKLAALVRGGPAADVAAFTLGAPGPPPKITPPPTSWFKQPAVLGGAGVLALAVIAGVLFLTRQPATPTPPTPPGATVAGGQRVAFFGFTGDDDAVAKNIAATATDEAFTSLGARHVDTSARADATVLKAAERLGRAKELGARYALSGDLRRDGDAVLATMRLENVADRTTTWEMTQRYRAGWPRISAVAVSDLAVDMTDCITTGYHTGLSPPLKPGALEAIVASCEAQASHWHASSATRWQTRFLTNMNQLAALYPENGDIAASIAAIAVRAGAAPGGDAAGKTFSIDADKALARARQLSPNSFKTVFAGIAMGEARVQPPLEWVPAAEMGVQRTPNPGEAFSFAAASADVGRILFGLGRVNDASRFFNEANQADPVSDAYGSLYGVALAATGQWEAKGQIESDLHKRDFDFAWEMAVITAVFGGVGDFEELAKQVPANVPAFVVPCYRDLAVGLKQKAQPARQAAYRKADKCLTDFDSPHAIMQAASQFGDLDRAFAIVATPEKVRGLVRSYYLPWFLPSTKAMRADPRFLPLMQQVGYLDYWKQTKTNPDVCKTPQEKAIPLCKALE